MKYFLTVLLLGMCFASFSQTYFVVRHAEKLGSSGSTMNTNPPLSDAGKQRAEALKDSLHSKKIGYVFSTNTLRTLSTAEPTANYFNLKTKIYDTELNDTFIAQLLSLRENVLIVGHSNTVDDIVNKLCGSVKIPGSLLDSAYDDLFVITKNGKTITFEARKYGNPSQ